MTPYGQNFQDYFVARRLFFEKEKKKELWILLGLLAQFGLVVTGAYLLPAVHLLVWAAAISISGILVLSGLISIAWKQRKYTSFDRWIKHREQQQSQDVARVSRQCSGKCCPGRTPGRKN
jgi:hypothetical protein